MLREREREMEKEKVDRRAGEVQPGGEMKTIEARRDGRRTREERKIITIIIIITSNPYLNSNER